MKRKVRDFRLFFYELLKLLFTLSVFTVGFVIETHAEVGWPDFRGPGGQGHASSNDLPLHWNESKNVQWKIPIPGRGWSTPVVFQGQIWMTTASEDGTKLYVLSIDSESGDILRNQLLFSVSSPQSIHDLNSYASPSPVIEPGRLYVHFGTYGTACLDTQSGEVVWSRRDIELQHGHGAGSSPVVWKHLLIFPCDGSNVHYVIALDKATGRTVWKTDRSVDYSSIGGSSAAYSTPLIAQFRGEDQLICPAAHGTMAYDLATGDELWKVRYHGWSNVSRPVVGNQMAYINTGYMQPRLLAVQLGGRGDVTDTHIVWIQEQAVPAKPSILLVEDLLFMVSDKGVGTCLDARTGETYWKKRLGGNFSVSPIFAAGRIYLCDHEGTTSVVAPESEFRSLATNTLDDGCMASPVVVDRVIYLRTRSHLYRIATAL